MIFYVCLAYFLTLVGFALFTGTTWLSLKKARQATPCQEKKGRDASQA